jgi:hypothetical protein
MISLVAEDVDFDMLSKNLWDKSQPAAGEDLTELHLRYDLFPSRVTFEIDGTVIIGPRRRVPLFDFLVCIARTARALRADDPTSLGFTEAADRVYFRPLNGNTVEVSTSGSGLLVQADRLDLIVALEEFLASGRTRLVDNVPGIQGNPQIVQLTV